MTAGMEDKERVDETRQHEPIDLLKLELHF